MTATALRTPTAVEILPPDAPRAAWLAERRNGIGGSDVPGIVGLSKYSSPWQVWHDKTSGLPDRQTEAMEWGRRCEPVVREWFTDHTGIPVARAGLLANVDRPHERGTVDGLTDDDGVLETKITSVFRAAEWADGQTPDDAELQTMHYLAVTGYEHAWVAVLIGGQHPELRHVERDEQLIADLREIEDEFWVRIREHRPPPVDGLDSTKRLLDGRWPNVDPESVRVLDPSTVDPILVRRALLRDRAAQVKLELTQAENELRELLGDAEWGVIAGSEDGRPAVTWRWHDRRGYTVEPTRYRLLTVKEII